MEWLTVLRTPEIRFGDFLVPWGMVMGAAGFLLALGVIMVLERLGWTREIWQLPVFFVGLAVTFGCGLGWFFAP